MSRFLSIAPLGARTETQQQLPCGTIEVLNICWPAPLDVTVIEASPVLEFSLPLPWREPARARFQAAGSGGSFKHLGRAMFKPPGVPLHVLSGGGNSYTARCVFSGTRFEELRQEPGSWDPSELACCLDVQGKSIATSLLRLAREARSPGFASQMLMEAACTTLLIDLLRHLRGKRAAVPRKTGGLSPRQLRRVQELIAATDGRATIAELATESGLSIRHLTRAFKESTGKTVGAYAEDLQLHRARAWLCESDLAIKQIAARLGFSHAKNFSTAFYRATGQAPMAYRHENRKRK